MDRDTATLYQDIDTGDPNIQKSRFLCSCRRFPVGTRPLTRLKSLHHFPFSPLGFIRYHFLAFIPVEKVTPDERRKKEHRNIVTTERDEKIEADEGKHEKGVFETKCIIEYRDDAHQALPEKVAAREWGRLESFEG